MKELKKKDIENLSYKDISSLILQREEKGLNTLDLFKNIVNLLELPESTIDANIADFYTSLTTDKRFVMVDGLWDLRSRHTSDKVLSKVEDEEEEEIADEMDEELPVDEDEEDIDYEEDIDDESYEDNDDDDGLSDLVVLDEEDMGLEDN